MSVYVLEGCDGTGKSTLADRIASETNGLVIHLTYQPDWDMHAYHRLTMEYAQQLSQAGITVILDRWALSELIYGTVFRGGPSYDTEQLMRQYDVQWVYCRNDNAVENHRKNVNIRTEMFDDVQDVFRLYEEYVQASDLNWSVFNFEEVITDDFIEELLGR